METDNSEDEYRGRPERRSQSSYKFKDTYLTRDEFNVATGKSIGRRGKSVNTDRNNPYYPNLQVLATLLPLTAIQQYPKLSLLVYEALHPYFEVFDNQYVSFFKQCIINKLIEK